MRSVGLVKGLGPTDQLRVRLGCQEREGFFDAGVDRAHALHVGGQDVGRVGADNDGGSAVAGDESFDGVGAGGAAPQHDGDGGHAGAHVFAEAVVGTHTPVVFAGQDAHVAAVPGQGDADDLGGRLVECVGDQGDAVTADEGAGGGARGGRSGTRAGRR